ncbi:unnamed protein product [Spirodela intermedia]|uniref:Uncharacterized protein n=1 Tax=Spirodela intermedia TaxID=51605 RepID=A0A7I8LDU9_SPIIN|nr:unnamed protein product [Spirodela intermedia]
MKQKIVIKLQMMDLKTRSKAMKIAVGLPAVESVATEGEDKDQIIVIGDGVDSVALVKRLRKAMGMAILVSVAAVEDEDKDKDKGKVEDPTPEPLPCVYYVNEQGYYQEPNCIIM